MQDLYRQQYNPDAEPLKPTRFGESCSGCDAGPELRITQTLTLRLKIAEKPYIVWSLGPIALKYGSLEPYGKETKIP